MMKNYRKYPYLSGLVVCSAALTLSCDRRAPAEQQNEVVERAQDTPVTQSKQEPQQPAAPAPANVEPHAAASAPHWLTSWVGSCEPATQAASALSRAADMADADGNGQISKQEAYSSADFLVGGFFFRADENADGTITAEEGKRARTELSQRYPALSMFLRPLNTPTGQNASAALADLLNVDYAGAVTAAQLRSASHQLVDEIFRVADTDKNAALTQAEARSARFNRVQSFAQTVFRTTDQNQDGRVALEEFRAALETPARMAFQLADINRDGALTQAEAAQAMQGFVRRLGLPEQLSGTQTATR